MLTQKCLVKMSLVLHLWLRELVRAEMAMNILDITGASTATAIDVVVAAAVYFFAGDDLAKRFATSLSTARLGARTVPFVICVLNSRLSSNCYSRFVCDSLTFNIPWTSNGYLSTDVSQFATIDSNTKGSPSKEDRHCECCLVHTRRLWHCQRSHRHTSSG